MSRDYLGNHIYENDTLVYTETPVGFIKNDTIYAYVKDYRGNERSVIDEFGNVAETNLFYPYGGLMTDDTQPSVSVQMRKFEGKEFDREYGQNIYDYHARMYDPYLCGFNSRDPQAEKYPDISPYAFCAANPNRFIDPTGEDILFAEDSSDQFIQDFYIVIKWLNNIGAGDIANFLTTNTDVTIYIKKGEVNNFNPNNMTISWINDHALITDTGYILTAGELLNHEMDHAHRYITDKENMRKDAKIQDLQYGNKEERRVVMGTELSTAQKTGQLKADEITRKSLYGNYYKTTSPISNDIIGIEIIYKQK